GWDGPGFVRGAGWWVLYAAHVKLRGTRAARVDDGRAAQPAGQRVAGNNLVFVGVAASCYEADDEDSRERGGPRRSPPERENIRRAAHRLRSRFGCCLARRRLEQGCLSVAELLRRALHEACLEVW